MTAMTTPEVQPETVLSRAPQVLSRVIDDEAVLLNLTTGTYCGMNEVATRAWEILQEPTSFDALCGQLTAEFEVEPATVRTDMQTFVRALADAKLIVASPLI